MPRVAKDPEFSEYAGESGLVNRWLKEIELVEQSSDQQTFERRGERIIKKFKNESRPADYSPVRTPYVEFNVLWSNVQVLEPALYSRMPKVIAERVFKDSDPVGRFAAELAERATHFNLLTQQDKFNYNVSMCVQDRLLPGRGQGWLVYKTEFEDATDEEGNPIVDDAGEPIKTPKPNTEKVEFQHLNYMDYLESKSRTQYEVRWRSRAMYYTRQEAIEEFGEEIGQQLNFDANPYEKKKKNQENEPSFLQQTKVYQVYDLTTKEVLWVSRGYEKAPLKRVKDPLKLKDFWCSPIPLLATCTSDTTYPTPDFVIYETLADELNYVVQRLGAMTECVRLVGMVATQANKDIKEMLRLGDGQLLPVQGWQAFLEKGGLAAMVSWLPFDQAVAAIPVLEARFSTLKAQIDEITSMPDIVRGSSDPNDPVYTQQQKAHWTVIKLVKKQQDVQRFCREIISKMAEIIFEPGFFSDETIWLMAGVGQMPPEKQELFQPALQLLRDDRLRTFRIDIETDSTIAMDENQALESWAKYLEGLNVIFSNVQSIMQFRPELMKPMLETAMGAIRSLRTGRAVEGAWEKALDEIEAADKEAKENPEPPPPDPQLLRAQNEQQKMQMDGQKMQYDWQMEQQKFQFETWLESQRLELDGMKAQGDLQMKHEANEVAAGKEFKKAEIEQIYANLEQFRTELEAAIEGKKLELEGKKMELDQHAHTLDVTERLLEEKRLAEENKIEVAKLHLDHKKIESQERIAEKNAKAKRKPTMQGGSKS